MEAFNPDKIMRLRKDGMLYSLYSPSYPLSVFIDHFLVAEGHPLFSTERLFPSNKAELFVNLGSQNECKLPFASERFVFNKTILSGLRSSYLEIFPGQYFFIAGMRFTLFGFTHLLRVPASEITNENFEASDVLGRETRELREKLGEATTDVHILNRLYEWASGKAIKSIGVSKSWQNVQQALQFNRNPDQKSLDSLMGYSHKHTIHLVRNMAGLSPKSIQRIYRLNLAFNYLHQMQSPNWHTVLHRSGYFDQSHFIREFREFTGFTPTEFIHQNPKDYELKQLR